MTKIGIKKTFNLHKYRTQIQDILSEWKIIITISVSVLGLIAGAYYGKGEEGLYLKFTALISEYIVQAEPTQIYVNFITCLVIPTTFFVALFFCGLSAYGGVISYAVPFVYSMTIGTITYFLYSEYKLKGLAFFVIIILPYAALSLLGIILMTVESVNMSQKVLNTLNDKTKRSNYNFTFYYKNGLKSYLIIILSAILKTVLDKLFISIFSF